MSIKKILLIAVFFSWTGLSLAQVPVSTSADMVGKAVTGELVDVSDLVAQSMRQMHQSLMISAEIATMEKYSMQFVNMTTRVPSVLALPPELAPAHERVVARLVPKNDNIVYKQANMDLRWYLMHLTQEEGTTFFYRGMRLSDLEAVDHVLMYGLETNKSIYDRIYMTGHIFIAEGYSGSNQGKIPVIVIMEHDAVANYLKPEMPGEFYSQENIPPYAISQVLAFLEIDGKPGWFRVVLDGEERVFMPIPSAQEK